MSRPLILAIDTPCDDSSAAVVSGRTVLSNIISSQDHHLYGGVFPTVAKQEHLKNTPVVVAEAMDTAGVNFADLAAIAVTQGPGLAPALEIGVKFAKELAVKHQLPLIAVNHLEGHALSPLALPELEARNAQNVDADLNEFDHYFAGELAELQFPILSVVVSGGHTEFILVKKIGEYQRLGFTVDDAAGEALDKFGREVGLSYPAGAAIEKLAVQGNPDQYGFPIPMRLSANFNLSFAGLKTSVKNIITEIRARHELSETEIKDLCASFQFAVFRAITYKLGKIQAQYHFSTIFLGGGVASNVTLRKAIENTTGVPLFVPYSKRLCVDNAAMIGLVAGWKLERGEVLKTAEEINTIERLPEWRVDAE